MENIVKIFVFFFLLKMSPPNPNATFFFGLVKEGIRAVVSVNCLEPPVKLSWSVGQYKASYGELD